MAIRFLHITRDEKFIDSLISNFELDDRTTNKYVIPDRNKSPLRYIKQKSKVTTVNYLELRKCLKKGEYDVVYFHAISDNTWKVIDWIPKTKIIIWWSWGFDLYHSRTPFLPPLISIPFLKSETKRFVDSITKQERFNLFKYLKGKYFDYCRRKNIRRIDYYSPVISIEYDLLNSIKGFRAKLFSNPRYTLDFQLEWHTDSDEASVLVGNSAYPSNNQLDVWRKIENVSISGKRFIFPLNYGEELYKYYIKENIHSSSNEIIFLQDFIPYDEYNELINSCKYAFLGVIRQQADGTVSLCMRHGIKLFLYEDSLMYKNLVKKGFVVFSIEKLAKRDLDEPLSREQAEHNFKTWIELRSAEGKLYDDVINEIRETLVKTK